MSLNQLVSPLVPLDVKVNTLEVKGNAVISENLGVVGDLVVDGKVEIKDEITGDLKVEGKVEAESFMTSVIQDKTITMTTGAFAGEQARVQAQRYGEYAFVDIYELQAAASGTGDAIILGALDPPFRPSKTVYIQCSPVERSNSVYMGLVLIETNGDITIRCVSASGGALLSTPFNPTGSSGWFNFSFVMWVEQLTPQGDRPALPTPLVRRRI